MGSKSNVGPESESKLRPRPEPSLTARGQATVEVNPSSAVKRVGEELTFVCRVGYAIDSCRVMINSNSHRLRPEDQAGKIVYFGQGLRAGECGVHIRGVEANMNGVLSCILPPQTGSIELTGHMNLTVAQAPGNPVLNTTDKQTFIENEELTAQCTVPGGRPAAKITWYIDDVLVTENLARPVVTLEPNSDLVTISQVLFRKVQPDDNGRKLICEARHEALQNPKTASRQLSVHYAPKRVKPMDGDPITIFGLKMGERGDLTVTVRANPDPHADWQADGRHLPAGEQNEWGAAADPVHLGNGYYNLTLSIPKITKEAVERTYQLTASNPLGSEQFNLRISTMDEPAGVELDTGAIVGIVVAVLVLLIAIFLIVFAKATDRWCFAGANRATDHTKSSGESSDTESAVGGRGERSRLAELSARVRAALPRAKDRVQAADPPAARDDEEKALSEEKKGVVYAELALGEQTGDKPPPPSTEYAEIVYTERPEQRASPERAD